MMGEWLSRGFAFALGSVLIGVQVFDGCCQVAWAVWGVRRFSVRGGRSLGDYESLTVRMMKPAG